MLSLANFYSSGREEGKKISPPPSQELLSSKQGKMNSLLESSRTFLKPHLQGVLGLLLPVPTSSAQPFRGALASRSTETPWRMRSLAQTSLPATARGPEQVSSEGKVAPEQRLL